LRKVRGLRRKGVSSNGAVQGEMGDVINLRKVRKQAKKRDDAERAAANRIVHGRSKVERDLRARNVDRQNRHLDGHKIDSGDA